jgi:hypothetical protein
MSSSLAQSFRKIAVDTVVELAAQDCLLCLASVARGLRLQTRQGKISAISQLVATLAAGERPGFKTAVIQDLADRPAFTPAADREARHG